MREEERRNPGHAGRVREGRGSPGRVLSLMSADGYGRDRGESRTSQVGSPVPSWRKLDELNAGDERIRTADRTGGRRRPARRRAHGSLRRRQERWRTLGDGMRRAWLVPLLLALILATPPSASAKFAVVSARVCGADGCQTITASDASYLPFEILGPLLESDRAAGERTGVASQPHYRVKLNLKPENTIRVVYLPEAGQVRVLRDSDTALEFPGPGQVKLNRGWIELRSERPDIRAARAETDVWARLVDGLPPIPGQTAEAEADAPNGSGFPFGLVIAAAVGAAILALLAAANRRPSGGSAADGA